MAPIVFPFPIEFIPDRITIIHRIAYVHFLEIRSRLPMIGRYSLASVSIQPHPLHPPLAVQPLSLSLCLSPSIILLSSSIFHATFNYERLSRCQGDATCEVTEEREKSFSFIGAHAYCTITSRGRTPWLCVQLATK